MIRRLAPAKINLYLRVVGKRPDGYHEIETIFERINLCDELTFESRPHDITLTGDESSLSCGDDNIVVRAAQLLQEVSGARQGAAIQHPRGREACSRAEFQQIAAWLANAENGTEVRRRLQDQGVTHILVQNRDRKIAYPESLMLFLRNREQTQLVYVSPDREYYLFVLA